MNRFDKIVLNDASIEELFDAQMKCWPLARENYERIENLKVRELSWKVRLQFNPSRVQSTMAKVDKETILGRKCFFCKENRPKEQLAIKYSGATTDYFVQVNPYPIFRKHFVIQSLEHTRQEIDSARVEDMLSLAKLMQNYVIFYNGPNAGASVPDHFHFQAGMKGAMPIEYCWNEFEKEVLSERGEIERYDVPSNNFLKTYVLREYTRGGFLIESSSKRAVIQKMGKIYKVLTQVTGRGNGRFEPDVILRAEKNFEEGGRWEPMMNILCWWVPSKIDATKGWWRIALFARGALRPKSFLAEGDARILIQPACVEMSGLFITPSQRDFERVNSSDLMNILNDVAIDEAAELKILKMLRNQPTVSVGIMHAPKVRFTFNGKYNLSQIDDVVYSKEALYEGDYEIEYDAQNKKLIFQGKSFSELMFEPIADNPDKTFWLRDVVIGVNFHWERKEDQKFGGKLKFIVENESVCPINILGVEDYLTSVISSEMSASASEELLKAHAVISRSWLLAQIEKAEKENMPSVQKTDTEYIKWYDREDHNNFDVCADDHCQRYQGLTRASTETVRKAIDATWGEILSYEDKICDARFYKCCGGVLEMFENAWEPKHYDYLVPVRDNIESVECEIKEHKYGAEAVPILDLTKEEIAQGWILSNPESLCNTKDAKVLSQVLNNYDQETVDFYRWKVSYTQEEIAKLIAEKSGEDWGEIIDLIPVERGTSGRLVKLKIVGTKKTLIIGKELEIRRLLSASHLYSSAFVVVRYDAAGNIIKKDSIDETDNKIPARFELIGAGWGHGVGLCQIGAAVMGEKGYRYNDILLHYYPNSEIVKRY